MLRMTEREYQALTGSKETENRKTGPPKQRKYRNVKVYIYEDGFSAVEKLEGHGAIKERYDSIKEYHRSQELKLLECAHRISNLQFQTPILISPSFTDKTGRKRRAVVYRADFTYEEDGSEIVEDVKGYSKAKKQYLCTETFRLKWKLLQNLYPDKEFRLY